MVGGLVEQADHLGFSSANAWAAAVLATFAKVPASKCWQALADLEIYTLSARRPRREPCPPRPSKCQPALPLNLSRLLYCAKLGRLSFDRM